MRTGIDPAGIEWRLVRVTDKPHAPPGGTLHDFASQGPYWWPDPGIPGGLPYIRRDGQINPEARGGPMDDALRVKTLSRALRTLADGASDCSESALGLRLSRTAELVRTFFLDHASRMNPSLNFAQAIPGRCTGRGIGIIDTVPFVDMLDALAALEAASGAPALPTEDAEGLRGWFARYLDWLLESPFGRTERGERNNHGTWCDAQLCSYALFTGRRELAAEVLREVAERRLDVQLAPDGSQPLELARTRPFDYSVFNLCALCRLASFGDDLGIDLRAHRTPGGASLGDAVAYMRRYAEAPETWPWGGIDPATGHPRPPTQAAIRQIPVL